MSAEDNSAGDVDTTVNATGTAVTNLILTGDQLGTTGGANTLDMNWSMPAGQTEEFLKSWKWLRVVLLKQLLSDNPQGIIEFRIDQKHTPSTLPEITIKIKFMPMKSNRKIRELEKPEL